MKKLFLVTNRAYIKTRWTECKTLCFLNSMILNLHQNGFTFAQYNLKKEALIFNDTVLCNPRSLKSFKILIENPSCYIFETMIISGVSNKHYN